MVKSNVSQNQQKDPAMLQTFIPGCLPLLIGSIPMNDHPAASRLIMDYTPSIPLWVQLPVFPEEGMVPQFLPGMPAVVEQDGKRIIDAAGASFDEDLLAFFEAYMAVSEDPDPPQPFSPGPSSPPVLDAELSQIIKVFISMALEMPLLLKGEPGTGKTMLAHAIAESLEMPLIVLNVKSSMKLVEALYQYDTLTRLNDSRFGDSQRDVSDIEAYIKMGKIGQAFVPPTSAPCCSSTRSTRPTPISRTTCWTYWTRWPSTSSKSTRPSRPATGR
jgi:hypothetical protein